MRRALVVALFALAIVGIAAVDDASAQCAMCRTALEGSEEGQRMAEKFNAGILFLLGAPISVVAGVAVGTRKNWRRSDDV